ncbi:MAG: phosphate/phosphite/phosphonate ABC transporter substrate-binding protein, partial [Phycisphaerae bacterium]
MPRLRFILLLLLVVLLVASAIWLGQMPNRGENAMGPADTTPKTILHLGLIPERDIYRQRIAYRALGDYLGAKLNCSVVLVTESTYRGVLDDFRDQQIDAAFLGSLVAVLAIDRFDAQVLVKTETKEGASSYHGVIFVPESSQIHNILELREHTLGAVRTTTAGALFPVHCLWDDNLLGTKYEPRLVWMGTHDDVIQEVFAGKLDAGAVKNLRLDAYLRKHPELKIRRLAKSSEVPENSLVVGKNLSPETQERLRQALLGMNGDSAGRSVLEALDAGRFVACNLQEFKGLDDMIDAIRTNWSEVGIEGPAPRRLYVAAI